MNWLQKFIRKITMQRVILYRVYTQKATLGTAFLQGNNNFSFKTLELPWKDNQQEISCIPEGVYRVKKRWSEKYEWHYHILNVPGREFILIHWGNFTREILGCILPGMKHVDIDGDGIIDVTESRKVMESILEHMDDEFELEIIEWR